MICNNCGYEFEGNFCPMCGTSVSTHLNNNPTRGITRRSIIRRISLIIILNRVSVKKVLF